MQIKIATLDDVGKVASLFDAYRQFYEQQPDLQRAAVFIHRRITRNESIILFAENDQQQAIGFCQMYPSFCSVIAARIYVLYDLFTKPEARKSGIGAALLNAANQHAKDNGVARIDLTTAKNNFTAQSLYESLGWVRDEIFYTYSKTV
jgi:ribosomal protein S18 acetylase RimI-like enzyme